MSISHRPGLARPLSSHILVAAFGLGALALGGCATQARPVSDVARADCASVPDTKDLAARHLAPGRVHAVAPVRETEFQARALQTEKIVGADLHVRAEPGVTAEYLERALVCHAASDSPVFDGDPLHPSSGQVASIRVRSEQGGFAIRALGESDRVAHEIWDRAEAYKSPRVTLEQVASVSSTSVR